MTSQEVGVVTDLAKHCKEVHAEEAADVISFSLGRNEDYKAARQGVDDIREEEEEKWRKKGEVEKKV